MVVEVEDVSARCTARMAEELRLAGRSVRTAEAYIGWVRRLLEHCGGAEPRPAEAVAFLHWLEGGAGVGTASRAQAASALRFFFEHVIGRRAVLPSPPHRPLRAPLSGVPARQEVAWLLAELEGAPRLVSALIYGGLRLGEALGLRVEHLDLETGRVSVGDGGRWVPLPAAWWGAFRRQLGVVARRLRVDLTRLDPARLDPAQVDPAVEESDAVWARSFLFPAARDRGARRERGPGLRGHLNPRSVQRALERASERCEIVPAVTCRNLRLACGVHLLEAGYPSSQVRQLMGLSSDRSLALCRRLARRELQGPRSPLEHLGFEP